MADLGQLNQFVDDYDFTFQFGRRTYRLKPPAALVLDFMRSVEGFKEQGDAIGRYQIWELVAPLFGSRFDRETFRFEAAGDEDSPLYGLIPSLLEQGMDIPALDRTLAAAHVKYMHGDDVAAEFIKTGSLGKALRTLREQEEAAAQETLQGTGETSETDSEAQKD